MIWGINNHFSARNCTENLELITESIPEAIVDFENRRSVCRWASYKYKEKRLEEIVRRLPSVWRIFQAKNNIIIIEKSLILQQKSNSLSFHSCKILNSQCFTFLRHKFFQVYSIMDWCPTLIRGQKQTSQKWLGSQDQPILPKNVSLRSFTHAASQL